MPELLESLGNAVLNLLTQPYYYISVICIAFIYRRQVLLERKLLHGKLHNWITETWRTVWTGLAVGLLVSLAGVALGISLSGTAVSLIWAVTVILLLIRVRYLCFACSIGVLGVIQVVLSWFPESVAKGSLGEVLTALREMDIPALLVLATVLHLVEALLLRWNGARQASPLYLEGKRGKVVGGYQLQNFWPLPLFLLIPQGAGIGELPWHPLLGGGLGLVSLPVIIGFSGMTQSMLPRRKAARTSGRLLVYSAVLLGLSMLAAWWSPLTLLASLAAVGLHEGLAWYSALEERQSSPFFVHPQHGLMVLAVLPGSPAQEMGILPGEIVLKVNGVLLTRKAQLHEALRMNPAFCKLEVQNAAGESKYLQRAIYDGDHHELGMILAPDIDEPQSIRAYPSTLYGMPKLKTGTAGKVVNPDTPTAAFPTRSKSAESAKG
ncbi:PDZ domain-containing protein [Paenibacillus sp. sgz500958]|uniref:PDZ domain-containing protein n=1 Tax=Paenibacillus sp. sgz500958 TaxID=3242475 RepID=UPI0036D42CA6